MAVAYLVDPNNQFMTKSGTINVGGRIRVYLAATDDAAVTYKDFSGTLNPAEIILDDNGRCQIICDNKVAYRIEVYDRYGALLWTQSPVWCLAAGGGASLVRVESTDGTIVVTSKTEGGTVVYDLSTQVEKEPAPYGTAFLSTSGLYATGEQFVPISWGTFGGDLTHVGDTWNIPYDSVADVDTDVVVTYDSSLPKSSIFVRMEVQYGNESMTLPTRELDMSMGCPSVHFSFKVPVHRGETLTYKLYYQSNESVSCGLDARSWLNLEINNLGDDPSENFDYEQLINKPSINGEELVGDKSSHELHLQGELTAGQYIQISSDVISVTGLQPSGNYVDNSTYTSYTASIDSSITNITNNITSIQQDITNIESSISGLTGTYVEQSSFTGYTASAESSFVHTGDMTAYQPSGNYQTAGDYVSSSDLSAYQLTADMTGYLPVSASGDFFTGVHTDNTLTGDGLSSAPLGVNKRELQFNAPLETSLTGDTAQVDLNTSFLSAYQQTADMSNYQTTADMSSYATTGDLSSKLDETASGLFQPSGDYVSSSELANYQPTSSMSAYQTTADMTGYLPISASGDFFTGVHTDNTLSGDGLSSSPLGVNKRELEFDSPLQTSLSGDTAHVSLDTSFMSEYQTTAAMSAYATTGDLANYQPTSSMGEYQTTAGMSGYLPESASSQFMPSSATGLFTGVVTDSSMSGNGLSSSPLGVSSTELVFNAPLSTSVSGDTAYVDLDTGFVSGFQPASAMSEYQTTAAMSAYATTGDLANYQPTSSMSSYQSAGNYASSSDLENYQPTSSMSAYQETSGMSAYVPYSAINIVEV